MSKKRKKKKSSAARIGAWTPVIVALLIGSIHILNAAGKAKQQSAAIIAGTVFQPSGHLLPGAKIEVVARGNPKQKEKTVSDARGDFAVRVPAGRATYTVTAVARGFEAAEKTVEVYEDEKVRTNLILRPRQAGSK